MPAGTAPAPPIPRTLRLALVVGLLLTVLAPAAAAPSEAGERSAAIDQRIATINFQSSRPSRPSSPATP